MQVSSVGDISSSMIQTATSMKAGSVQADISTAVLKNLMDQQKTQSAALVKMIANNSGIGTRLDISV